MKKTNNFWPIVIVVLIIGFLVGSFVTPAITGGSIFDFIFKKETKTQTQDVVFDGSKITIDTSAVKNNEEYTFLSTGVTVSIKKNSIERSEEKPRLTGSSSLKESDGCYASSDYDVVDCSCIKCVSRCNLKCYNVQGGKIIEDREAGIWYLIYNR